MGPDGFPERGYGNWRQYRRRQEKAFSEDNPAMTGVQCRRCVGLPGACQECIALFDDWSIANFGVPGRSSPLSAADKRVAAR